MSENSQVYLDSIMIVLNLKIMVHVMWWFVFTLLKSAVTSSFEL